jgi:serine/threonine protein kinase
MAAELKPSSQFAGYRVERLVGRGGMGSVYRAVRLEDDAPVALKVVLSSHAQNPRFLARFAREGRLASALDHPHLVRVYEAGTEEGVPFLAMAFVEGVDLDGVIAESGALHPAAAARITAQVASGLDAAHERGLVHRDVKPQNVLLERRASGAHAYLADFGLSKHVESTSGVTGTGQWVGTVEYAAPEQVQAEPTDSRTVVYSLGCVLYKALTGSVPYPRDRDVDAMLAHITGPPPKVTDITAEAPGEFDPVIRRAMAGRPEDRYQSAGELGEAAVEAAREAGPEPADAIAFPAPGRAVDSDAPTAG